MGRFSTTVHVKDNVGRIEFINSFCGIMKNHGFVPCSDDEAEQSYVFAFGDGWVTLVNKDYKDDRLKAGDDAMNMSAALKTSAFMMDVIDSDFAYIHLFAPNGGKDGVAVGDTSGYGVEKPKRGKQKFWKPLLAEGKTWEQFSETVAKNAVFVEETLVEMAEELKIDPDYIYADFNELMNLAGENKNVQPFYFKNAAGKRVTLKAAFKRVFGEALEPLGFKLIKGKYPYFVRVVPGGEIIHIISYMEEWCPDRGKKAFNVIGGIATVYRHKIDLGVSPKDNCDWLYTIAKFYWMTTPKSEYDKEYGQSICHFMFDENSESSLYDAVNYTLELTRKHILPQLSTAVDIRSSLSYLKRIGYNCCINNFDRDLSFGGCGNADEGFLYIVADDEELKGMLESQINGTIPTTEEEHQRAVEHYEFFNDPVIHPKVLLEIERRKAQNTENPEIVWIVPLSGYDIFGRLSK